MISVSLAEFMGFVAMRRGQSVVQQDELREKVLRRDQLLNTGAKQLRRLATCPVCDAVIAADMLDPKSGLCPRCHAEASFRR